MRRHLVLATILSAIPFGTAVSARQSIGGGTGRDVVVTGHKSTSRERAERASRFIADAGVLRDGRQLARWIDPICVKVSGVDAIYASIMVTRVREVASQIGASVAPAGCKPNAVIAFTDDGAGLARAVLRKAPASLAEVPSDTRAAVLNGRASVRWWYMTATQGADGRELITLPPIASPFGGENGSSVIPDLPTLNVYTSSMVATYNVRAIRHATAVIDATAAGGQTLNTIADYAAMVMLAELRLRTPPPAGSVLGAFENPDAPKRLTPDDRAFLTALYRTPLDRAPAQQKGAITASLAKTMP